MADTLGVRISEKLVLRPAWITYTLAVIRCELLERLIWSNYFHNQARTARVSRMNRFMHLTCACEESAVLPCGKPGQHTGSHLPRPWRGPRIHVRRGVGVMQECRLEPQERDDLWPDASFHRPLRPVLEVRLEV